MMCSVCLSLWAEFSLFSYNNGMVMSSCRELDNNRSALSAASAFAIATAGANEGTPTKEKYRRMSLASTGRIQQSISISRRLWIFVAWQKRD